MSEVLSLLSHKRVVHADLKPENILIKLTADNSDIEQLKLIDFGSSFFAPSSMDDSTQRDASGNSITASTPEYLAPEVLSFIERRKV